MIKKFVFFPVLILILIIPCIGTATASEPIAVSDISSSVSFPSKIDFYLKAESSVDITDVRLCYRVDRTSFTNVTSEIFIDIIPARAVDVSWSMEMVKLGGLPPGVLIEYWWLISDKSGFKLITDSQTVRFDDKRFNWRTTAWQDISIFWYQGNESFAQELAAAVQNAVYTLANYTGVYPKEPVNIYIYASAKELQDGMIFPQEWTGGVAFTRYNTLAIAISAYNLDWGRRTIAHEITHLIVDQIVISPYSNLPVWLEEGLAMHIEGELEQMFITYFNRAISDNRLLSLRTLSSPFSAYSDESALSYAQSYSVVDFLVNTFGRDKILQLLNTFKQGADYDSAFMAVYGYDMDGIERIWKEYIFSGQIPVVSSSARSTGESVYSMSIN